MKPRSKTVASRVFDLRALAKYFSERSSQAMLAVEGKTYIVRYANPAFLRLAGIKEAALIGRTFASAVPEQKANDYLALLKRVFRTGKPQTMLEQLHEAPAPVYWSYAVWPIYLDDGSRLKKSKPVGLMIHVTDSTEIAVFRANAGAVNEALMLSALRERGLVEESAALNASLARLNGTLEARVLERTALAEGRTRQVQSLAADLASSEERERRKIAQVLHDSVQQLLVAAKMRANVAASETESMPLRAMMGEIEGLMDQCISETRTLTAELSPMVLYEGGLPAGLEWLAQWMHEKHGLRVRFSKQGEVCGLALDVEVFLFQSVRELLFNAVKHAKVRSATVQLGTRDAQVMLTVEDRGAGYDMAAMRKTDRGLGLVRLRERLEFLGGSMEVRSAPGRGTLTTLCVPLAKQAAAEAPMEEAGQAPPQSESRR